MLDVNKWGILFFFCLIIISVSALAESGCFLYPESSLYCSDVERQPAEEECSLFEDCSIGKTFNPGRNCQDLSAFPECQRVLCKSSCQQEFAGKCGAGAIPPGERELWCSPGCCRFTSRNQNNCEYTSNKWFCEVEVRNKLVPEFNFDPELLEPECNQECIMATAAATSVTAGLLLENVSAGGALISPPTPPTSSPPLSSSSKIPPEQLLSGPSGAVLGVILLLIALLSLFYYWHQKKIHGSFFSGSSFLSEEKEERSLHPFLPFLFSPQSRARMEQSKLNHIHKVKHKQRAGFLREVGMKTTIAASAEFKRLQQLVKNHEHQKKLSPDLGRSQVQRLQRRLSPPSRKPVSPSSPSKADQQSILSKLRKLAKK